MIAYDFFLQDFLLYLNHVGLCTEEISESGEGYVVWFNMKDGLDLFHSFAWFLFL